MHELAATEHLLRLVLEEAEKAGAKRVTKISLRIGEWSSFVPECIRFYLGIVAEGTPAEGAALDWQVLPVRFECDECGDTFAYGEGPLVCPSCNSPRAKMTSGREFEVVEIEVEDEDPGRP